MFFNHSTFQFFYFIQNINQIVKLKYIVSTYVYLIFFIIIKYVMGQQHSTKLTNSTKSIKPTDSINLTNIKCKQTDEIIQDIMIKLIHYNSESEKEKIINHIINKCLNILICSTQLNKFKSYKIMSLCDLMNLVMLIDSTIDLEYFEELININDELLIFDLQTNISDFITRDLIKYNPTESEQASEQFKAKYKYIEIYNFDKFDVRFVIFSAHSNSTNNVNNNITSNNILHTAPFNDIELKYSCKYSISDLIKKEHYDKIKECLNKKDEHINIYLKLINESKLCVTDITNQKKYVEKLTSMTLDDIPLLIAKKQLSTLNEELAMLEQKTNAIFEICFNDFQEFTPSDVNQLNLAIENCKLINQMTYNMNEINF